MCLKRITTQDAEKKKEKNDEFYAKTEIFKKKLNEIFSPEKGEEVTKIVSSEDKK
jgi:hypothetical protein